MSLLRAEGGVHAGVHSAGEGEAPGPLDLWTLRDGDRGRQAQVAEENQRRRGDQAPRQVLRELSVGGGVSERGFVDLGGDAPLAADSGLAEKERVGFGSRGF